MKSLYFYNSEVTIERKYQEILKNEAPVSFTSIYVHRNRAMFFYDHLIRLEKCYEHQFNENFQDLQSKISDFIRKDILEHICIDDNYYLRISLVGVNRFIAVLKKIPVEICTYEPLKLKALEKNAGSGPIFFKVDDYEDTRRNIESISKSEYHDLCYVDNSGNILESSFSNLCFFIDDEFIFPESRPGVLEGICQKNFINFLKITKKSYKFESLSLDRAFTASSVYQLNCLKGLRPVEKLNNVLYDIDDSNIIFGFKTFVESL